MTGRFKLGAGVVLAVFVALVWILVGIGDGAAASALSHGARGWSLAREYVAQRGVSAEISASSNPVAEGSEVLVLAFPWQVNAGEDDLEAIRAWLKAGGTLLTAYSGNLERMGERAVMDLLRLEQREVRSAPPWRPFAWWSYYGERWSLAAPIGAAIGRAEIEAPRRAPKPPMNAEILLRETDLDLPLAFRYSFGGGLVVVVPVSLFANSALTVAGNLDVLESLVATLPPTWRFDEYHHGLVKPGASTRSTLQVGSWELFMVHLIVVYALALASLARPFGPPWAATPLALASTRSFLRGIGALHRRLGHHQRAAELLQLRLATLDRNRSPKPEAESNGDKLVVTDDRSLLSAAKALEDDRALLNPSR